MIGLYILTNMIDNKQYIGMTLRNIVVRIEEHLSGCSRGSPLIYEAIKKHGRESFLVSTIVCDNPEIIPVLEQKLIEKLNTGEPHGYNVVVKTKNTSINKRKSRHKRQSYSDTMPPELKGEIIGHYESGITVATIARIFNLSPNFITQSLKKWGVFVPKRHFIAKKP